jgi:hypothetical protein
MTGAYHHTQPFVEMGSLRLFSWAGLELIYAFGVARIAWWFVFFKM